MDKGETGRMAAPRRVKRGREARALPETVFEGACRAPAKAVFALLADLPSHLEWAGERQTPTTRLLTMEAPPGPATVGTEFRTTGSDGKTARWTDQSVVTEAIEPATFEFVTTGVRHGKPGRAPMELTTVHRYEIIPAGGGCRVRYRGEITRHAGLPAIVTVPIVARLLLGYAAKYMRTGFDALIAVAEERSEAGGEAAR